MSQAAHAPLCAVSSVPCPAPQPHVAGASAPYRGCSAAGQCRVVSVCARRHGRIAGARPRAWPAVSWAGCVVLQHNSAFPPQACCNTICLYCDTGFLTSPSAYCNTIHCIAIQFSSSPSNTIPVAIQFCIATQPSLFLQYNSAFQPSYCNINQPAAIQKPLTSLLKPLSCNTNWPYCNTTYTNYTSLQSQYNHTLAIQSCFFFSQYNLGSSPKRFYTTKFFFSLLIIFFPLFPAVGKIIQIYIYFFP